MYTKVRTNARRNHRFNHFTPIRRQESNQNDTSNTDNTKSALSDEEKTNQPLMRRQNSLPCRNGSRCEELKLLWKTYRTIKARTTAINATDITNHCILHHVDDYPDDNICFCKQWDSKSIEIQHLIHGHWFHRNTSTKYQNDQHKIEKRRKKTETVKYRSLTRVTSFLNAINAPNESDKFDKLQFGQPFCITKHEAKFKNPKEELLKNDYKRISKSEWNELLKKSVYYAKAKEARKSQLTMKELVSLKIYTDFDELQRAFRLCFRTNSNDTKQRQSQFFWWNRYLGIACSKSKDVISTKIFHGVSVQLTVATFSGTYYGPVSTTSRYDIAKAFAGKNGKIFELYPSFGRKGLKVYWLSNFPDEEEILYMNTSFQICNIYEKSVQTPKMTIIGGLNANNDAKQSHYFERSVIKAIQTVNVESKVLSLNTNDKYTIIDEENDDNKEKDESNFDELSSKTQLAILYLLYLQYRKKEWTKFIKETSKYTQNAIEKFRDEFVQLAENVKAVKMERLARSLQIFFYTQQKQYTFPSKKEKQKFVRGQALCMATIVRLFPNAEQISINAQNWDWSLNKFIDFLKQFDMDYANVKLQDIYIKFVRKRYDKSKSSSSQPGAKKHISEIEIVTDNKEANKLLIENSSGNARRQLRELRKLGWIFQTSSHLHRVGFEPTPELPFIMVFCKPRRNTRFFYRSYSLRFTSQQIKDVNSDDEKDEKEIIQDMDEGQNYVVVDHNPANCVLSKKIFDSLDYKKELIGLIIYKYNNPNIDYKSEKTYKKGKFIELCGKVHRLVLDPMPDELKSIFMGNNSNTSSTSDRAIISFENIYKIFPNANELFLRNTILNLRICYKLVQFVKKHKYETVLQKIFFSKMRKMEKKHVMRFQLVLNPMGWDVVKSESMLHKLTDFD